MSKSIVSLLIVGIALSTILLIACSDESTDTSAPSTESTSTDTSTSSTGSTSTDTSTSSTTSALTGTLTPSETSAAMATTTALEGPGSANVAEYEAFCSELPPFDDFEQFSDADSMSYGQAAAGMSAMITAWEASNPPAEAAAWHSEMLTAWQSLKAVFDTQSGDTVWDDEDEAVGLASISLLVTVVQAEGLLPRDIRNAMVSAGCLGADATQDNHGDEQSTAATIALGDEIEGALDYLGDTDYFVFTAEAGTSYRVDMSGDFGWAFLLSFLLAATEEGDSTIDESALNRPSRIVLYDSAGTELQSSELSLITFAEGIFTWEATAGADYYISLGDWELGEYTLSVVEANDSGGTAEPTTGPTSAPDDHGNDIGSATVISVGAPLEAVIDYERDVDYFRFTANAGQTYEIDVALGTLEDSWLNLRDSDDVFLASNDDYAGTYASRVIWLAPASGNYYIRVGSYWGADAIGSYTLTVSLLDVTDDHANHSSGATTVSVGTAAAGVIDYEEDVDYFRFTAQAGQLYEVDVTLGTLDDSYLSVDSPELAQEVYIERISNDDYGETYASRVIWFAPVSGNYYAEVSGSYGATGSYTLTVSLSDITDDHGNDIGSATPALVGTAAAGSIDYEKDVDYFRFTADAGQQYQIDVALGTLEDSKLALFGQDGVREAYNDDYGETYASRIVWSAPASGDYFIEVSTWGSAEGSYTLTVTETVP